MRNTLFKYILPLFCAGLLFFSSASIVYAVETGEKSNWESAVKDTSVSVSEPSDIEVELPEVTPPNESGSCPSEESRPQPPEESRPQPSEETRPQPPAESESLSPVESKPQLPAESSPPPEEETLPVAEDIPGLPESIDEAQSSPNYGVTIFWSWSSDSENSGISYERVWNPDTYSYDSWKSENNYITVSNDSSGGAEILVTLHFTPGTSGIDMSFLPGEEDMASGDFQVLENGDIEIMLPRSNGENSVDVYLWPEEDWEGVPSIEYQTLGVAKFTFVVLNDVMTNEESPEDTELTETKTPETLPKMPEISAPARHETAASQEEEKLADKDTAEQAGDGSPQAVVSTKADKITMEKVWAVSSSKAPPPEDIE